MTKLDSDDEDDEFDEYTNYDDYDPDDENDRDYYCTSQLVYRASRYVSISLKSSGRTMVA